MAASASLAGNFSPITPGPPTSISTKPRFRASSNSPASLIPSAAASPVSSMAAALAPSLPSGLFDLADADIYGLSFNRLRGRLEASPQEARIADAELRFFPPGKEAARGAGI